MPVASTARRKQPAGRRLFAFSGRRPEAGFTLLEVMAVLVIIGIIMTFAALSAGGDRRAEQMEREARRLVALLQLASEEAVTRSEQLALHVGEREYAFMKLQNREWMPLDEPPLQAREMPEGIELDLELEENPPPGLTAEEADMPQVFLLSSGEMTPFELSFFAPGSDQRYLVKATLLGRLELE